MKEKIEDIDNLATVIIAMQTYGNQRFNAALSEAIEKIETEYIYSDKIFQAKTVIEILEGLKIKP